MTDEDLQGVLLCQVHSRGEGQEQLGEIQDGEGDGDFST